MADKFANSNSTLSFTLPIACQICLGKVLFPSRYRVVIFILIDLLNRVARVVVSFVNIFTSFLQSETTVLVSVLFNSVVWLVCTLVYSSTTTSSSVVYDLCTVYTVQTVICINQNETVRVRVSGVIWRIVGLWASTLK